MAEKKEAEKKTTAKKSETKEKVKKQAAGKAEKKEKPEKTQKPEKVEKAKKELAAEAKKETASETETKTETIQAPNAKLQKKRERREAKAARKAANMEEEKKRRPNNAFIALFIFGILIGMFAIVALHNYFSKPASLEKYIEENGGADIYGNFMVDENVKAAITAKGNSMNIELTAETEDEELIKSIKESYADDGEGKEEMEKMAAYFLTSLKPQARGFGADVTAKMSLNGEEISSVNMTYNQAKDKMKEVQKEAEEAAADANSVEVETEKADDSAE